MAQNLENFEANQAVEHGSVLPALQDQMNVDLVAADNGKVCIFHDKSLNTRLEYIEFYQDTGELVFVFRWGILQPLGEKIPANFRDYLAAQETILVILNQNGQMKDIYDAKLLVHGATQEEDL